MAISCKCPTPSFYGPKIHSSDCPATCPYMTSKDRYSAPKRCSKPMNRGGLCAAHAGVKERLEAKRQLKVAYG